jgi:tetratricopeptide (TPR) repeat protein
MTIRPNRIVALLAALLSGSVFYYCMAPGVTLGDSGELATAAFTLGVPHPPGYPLWTLLGFLWSHLIVPWGDPAWRINLMSVFSGGLLVGILVLANIRCIHVLIASLTWGKSVPERKQHQIAMGVGLGSALFFAFNRGVWHWACVSEMHILDILVLVLVVYAFTAWIQQQDRFGYLNVVACLLGASFPMSHTSKPILFAILTTIAWIGIEHMLRKRQAPPNPSWINRIRASLMGLSIAWEVGAATLISHSAITIGFWFLTNPTANIWNYRLWDYPGWAVAGGLIALGLVICGWISGWWRPWRSIACAGSFLAGSALFLYLPLAASTNPPMNWGFAATKTGFAHMLQRGSYERMTPAFFNSPDFATSLDRVWQSFTHQYSLPLCMLGLLSLLAMILIGKRTDSKGRITILFLGLALLSTVLDFAMDIRGARISSLSLTTITDSRSAPSHLFASMLIGTGVAIVLSLVATSRKPFIQTVFPWVGTGLLLLPLIPLSRNWQYCDQHQNNFGQLLGRLIFNPGTPYLPMEKNAVLFAGTDNAKFVSTYMISCESQFMSRVQPYPHGANRSDVYLLWQNALADSTYMAALRDQYDFSRPTNNTPLKRWLGRDLAYPNIPIHIPSTDDANKAFRQYGEDVQAQRIPKPSDPIKGVKGRGTTKTDFLQVGGVMQINGILANWIFTRNREQHAFYVEESYLIPWMFPHFQPAGIIMKLNPQALPSPQENPALWKEITDRDRVYWDHLTDELISREDFQRDQEARQCFSHLRTTIAGLYFFRDMNNEAEYAFRQAIQLDPRNFESYGRLAQFLLCQARHAEARSLIEAYQKLEPNDLSARRFGISIQEAEKDFSRQIH